MGNDLTKLNSRLRAQIMAVVGRSLSKGVSPPAIASQQATGTKAPRRARNGLPVPSRQRVERTRNMGKWTESEYWGRTRSALREAFRYWGPAMEAKKQAKVGVGRSARWLCAGCGKLFLEKGVHVDHIVPCGALTAYEHLPDFLRRLTPDSPDAYMVLCRGKGGCHQKKTNKERT